MAGVKKKATKKKSNNPNAAINRAGKNVQGKGVLLSPSEYKELMDMVKTNKKKNGK